MQHDNAKNKGDEKASERNMLRKLEQLQEMQEYCCKLKCRRNTLIQHFGGTPVDCKMTCDYCCNPKKVEQATTAAKAIKDTRNQYKKKGKDGAPAWDGQWGRPHGDDDDEASLPRDWGDGIRMGELRVTGPLEVDPGDYPLKGSLPGCGFAKASEIISRYESMEAESKKYAKSGFSSMQSHRAQTRESINIPPHLAASLVEASSNRTAERRNNEGKSKKPLTSNDYANNVEEIKQRVEKLKEDRESRLKALQANKVKEAPPPPPPPLSFGRKKHLKASGRKTNH
jgi:RecQ zinc-binding